MADKRDQWADTLSADHSGWLTGFLAEENKIDRRMLWRLGSWGVAAVGAVVVAVLASQSQIQLRRDQFSASDMLARQAQQLQFITKEAQAENKRLTLAIESLGSDRDRLYARVTSMEQGLEAATGSIKRQQAPAPTAAAPAAPMPPPMASAPPSAPVAAPPSAPPPVAEVPTAPPAKSAADLPTIPSAPAIGPVASKAAAEPTPADPAPPMPAAVEPTSPAMAAWKSMIAPIATPDASVNKPSEPAVAAPSPSPAPETTASVSPAAAMPEIATPVARTEFGVDIGGANSVDGLRAIWRGVSKSKQLDGLRPIMMVKERGTGLGMQLRLIAGPVMDAAAAAKICAALTESGRPCETTVFDGQRLALKAEPAQAPAVPVQRQPTSASATPSAPAPSSTPPVVTRPLKPIPHKRAAPKPEQRTEQAPKPVEEPAPPPPKPQSSLSTFLGVN
jgi:hypothetical protein